MTTKGNLFMSLKGNFRCQFVYSLHGVLAKIILRSCVTGDGAICIKNGTFEYFDSLRTADAFPVVASLPFGGREATTGNASAVRRLVF